MSEATYRKDPSAILDYQINWATWLGSDTISSSTWIVTTGITKVTSTNTTTTATVWLSGGTAGQTYTATNTIVTTAGRTDQRTITIVVSDK